jgi:hypothetical protein
VARGTNVLRGSRAARNSPPRFTVNIQLSPNGGATYDIPLGTIWRGGIVRMEFRGLSFDAVRPLAREMRAKHFGTSASEFDFAIHNST